MKFDLNPTPESAGGAPVDISTSFYHDDTVPWKSSQKRILVAVDGGPQFSICDDNYRFSVIEDGKPEQWTNTFNNDDVKFVKYAPGLRADDAGFVLGGTSEAAATFANQSPMLCWRSSSDKPSSCCCITQVKKNETDLLNIFTATTSAGST